MGIFGHDPEESAYTWFDIDSTGMNASGHGSLEEHTWTFLFGMKAGGKPVQLKVELEQESPTVMLNTADVSVNAKPWNPTDRSPVHEGRVSRKGDS